MYERCNQERAVIEAEKSGGWTAALQAHIDGCSRCSEALRICRTLASLKESTAARIPSAAYVWRISQIRERQIHQRFVIRLLLVTRASMLVFAGLGLIAWMVRHREPFSEDVRILFRTLNGTLSFDPSSGPVTILSLGLVLLLINIGLTVRSLTKSRKS